MSLVSPTRIRRVHVALKAVNTLFVCSQRNKKLLTSAQQNCSTPFFRCRKHDPATTSSMMMTGLHTRTVTAPPLLQATGHPSGAPKDREKAGHVEVLRDPYEWKSALGLASALFVASLALAPLPAVDHKNFATEINTKTLRAAAAVTIPPRGPLRVRH